VKAQSRLPFFSVVDWKIFAKLLEKMNIREYFFNMIFHSFLTCKGNAGLMDKKDLSEISNGLRSTFQRAVEAQRKNNLEYAQDLFKTIIKKEPGVMPAREGLRDVQRKLTAQVGGFAKLTNALKNIFATAKIKKTIKSDPVQAMGMAEDLLIHNLSDPTALNLLAEAALAADADFVATEAYEVLREYAPRNEKNLRRLADVYKKDNEGGKVLEIFKVIAAMHPGDLGVQQELRSATALASMEKGHWEEEGDYHNKMKDTGEAVKLEKEDRVARAEDDIAEMIVRYEKSLADGDDDIEIWRKLADYYFRAHRFDDAIKANEKIMAKLGVKDALVDRNIEKAMVGKLDLQIDEAKKGGGDVAALEKQKYELQLNKATERVNAYPSDTRLRFELAVLYWEGNFTDEALEQFQFAQRNPQNRLASIVYMGRCFHKKGQLDLGIEQIEKAVAEMHAMDKTKMEAMYYLGLIYEDSGKRDKAGECFKTIYQNNINFKDVADKVKAIYG